jgi:hypothetical protein
MPFRSWDVGGQTRAFVVTQRASPPQVLMVSEQKSIGREM